MGWDGEERNMVGRNRSTTQRPSPMTRDIISPSSSYTIQPPTPEPFLIFSVSSEGTGCPAAGSCSFSTTVLCVFEIRITPPLLRPDLTSSNPPIHPSTLTRDSGLCFWLR